MSLTLKAVKAELAMVGISLSKQDSEYRVAFKGTKRNDTYSEAYFTSDLADAWKTGLIMAVKAVR